MKEKTHFYPRSPCGERPCPISCTGREIENFYPRSPCGERRCPFWIFTVALLNFYPRSPCGERRVNLSVLDRFTYFYPRSPCGERLFRFRFSARKSIFLSTLSLRRATNSGMKWQVPCTFLSTLSLRRATKIEDLFGGDDYYFYPRSPCGERLCMR